MQQTLVFSGPEDFWWLKNGVTVVASRAVQGGKILTVEDLPIANGQFGILPVMVILFF